MQIHGLCDHYRNNLFWTEEMNEKEVQCKDIGVILTYIAKYFCTRIKACQFCKYKTQGLQKTFYVIHHHSCEGLLSPNM